MHEIEKCTIGNVFPQRVRLGLKNLIPSDMGYRSDLCRKAQHFSIQQSQAGMAAKLMPGLKEQLKAHTDAEQGDTGLGNRPDNRFKSPRPQFVDSRTKRTYPWQHQMRCLTNNIRVG
jgi:hypothetical protein